MNIFLILSDKLSFPIPKRKTKGEVARMPSLAINMETLLIQKIRSYNKVSILLILNKMTEVIKYKCRKRK
jgi:hypothetical protein